MFVLSKNKVKFSLLPNNDFYKLMSLICSWERESFETRNTFYNLTGSFIAYVFDVRVLLAADFNITCDVRWTFQTGDDRCK